jgi:hypothetical protein
VVPPGLQLRPNTRNLSFSDRTGLILDFVLEYIEQVPRIEKLLFILNTRF